MSNFSKNLKFLREQKGLSQNKLAEMSNVYQTTIARWENEEASPSLDNILDVANALHISIADLTGKDLTQEQDCFDEIEILFANNKDVLTEDDKEYIKFIIEKRRKEIDKELGKNGE